MPGDAMTPIAMTPINPPASYSWWWAVTLLLALAGIVLLWWRTRRVLRGASDPAVANSLDELRAQTLADLDRWHRRAASGTVTEHAAASAMSACARRFVGIATDGDTDYSTLLQLRRDAVKDPRLEPLVQFITELEPALFDATTPVDLDRAHATAKDVVTRWR